MSKENRVSDERLDEIKSQLGEDTFAGIVRTVELKVPEFRSILTELQSLRSKPVAGVEVKPLEWHRITQGFSLQRAATTFGDYRIWVGDDGGWFWAFNDQKHSDGAEDGEAAAKAAAEANYRQRILSSLSLPAQDPVADCEVELERSLKFVQPKLIEMKKEKGLIGLWCHAWRMAWKSSVTGSQDVGLTTPK